MSKLNDKQPLWQFLQEWREDGASIAAFPTTSGERYALRLYDPSDPSTGLAYLASFAKSVKEADRDPNAKPAVLESKEKALDDLLDDPNKCAKYVVLFWTIEQKDVDDGFASDDQVGNQMTIICAAGTTKSDIRRTSSEASAESAKPTVKRSSGRK